jgi:hypothetical protein
MLRPLSCCLVSLLLLTGVLPAGAGEALAVLKPEAFGRHVERFNRMEDENWTNSIPNSQAWAWMKTNVPFFECPDEEIEEMYYFRWWSYRKHLVQTTNGWVVTEFLAPMKHAGAFNTISSATGHHLTEGRWLRDGRYLDDCTRFWFRGNQGRPQPHFHKFSGWVEAAAYDRFLVSGDAGGVVDLLEDFVADYRLWEREQLLTNGLFWQFDVRDAMEESISGSRTVQNARPTINSYQYGNARAIAAIARLARREDLAGEFDRKAAALKRLVEESLWNPADRFFEARRPDGSMAGVREQLGFIPWCFDLPDARFDAAWTQVMDPAGFCAPYGLTTAERRSPAFRTHGCCKCEWDGPVWPFATSQTLTALARALRERGVPGVTPADYFNLFRTYVRSQHFDGKPYVGEYLDEVTGQWLKGRQERSRYYNHSLFADLVISGVVGVCPRADSVVEIQPLASEAAWDWFCLDGVAYHGRNLTVIWDRSGARYGQGKGLSVLADGRLLARSDRLGKLSAQLP